MTLTDAQARHLAEGACPDAPEGTFARWFIDHGVIPFPTWPLAEQLALGPGDRGEFLGYLADHPAGRAAVTGWERLTA